MLSSDEVAKAWNGSISRFGIQSLYPPQEDLHVGDIWAVVVQSDGASLLGKSVRIAHINLKPLVLKGGQDGPVFADTPEPPADHPIRGVPRVEVSISDADTQKISTAIAAFPAITINHTAKTAANAGFSWLGLGGARDGNQIELIRIRSVETYGAPAIDAYGAFAEWCTAPDTQSMCRDDRIARNLLAAATTPSVLEQKDGKYTTEIELRLITRIFMTREIEARRFIVDSRGAVAQVAENSKPEVTIPATGSGGVTPTSVVALPVGVGGKATSQWSNELEVGLSGVFQRPVVFGFRSLKHTLKVSPPSAGALVTQTGSGVAKHTCTTPSCWLDTDTPPIGPRSPPGKLAKQDAKGSEGMEPSAAE